MDRRRFLLTGLPAVAAGIAGCSGGEETPTDSPGATDSPTPTQTEQTETGTGTGTPTSTSTSTTDPTETPTPEPTATAQADLTVAVAPGGALRFEPETFEVAVGETVRWEWESPGHNVSPTEGEQPDGADWAGEDERTYDEGHAYSETFEVAGEYAYHCDPHRSSGMTGSFTVR